MDYTATFGRIMGRHLAREREKGFEEFVGILEGRIQPKPLTRKEELLGQLRELIHEIEMEWEDAI